MPRPPILEPVNFEEIFNNGQEYADWLKGEDEAKNAEKMESLREAIEICPSNQSYLRDLRKSVKVIAFAEGWCGDVHRHVPVLIKMAQCSDQITVRFTSREASQEAFKRYLTNGGEAVPKFVFFNENFVECGNFGPMPLDYKKIIARGKAAENVKAARERVSKLYESDPNCEAEQAELLELFGTAACTRP